MPKYRTYSNLVPSVLIRELISEDNTHSGDLVDCEACNRTHLSKNWKMSLGKREIGAIEGSLRERPEKYCFTDDSEPIYYSEFDGKKIVLECPCNFLTSVEERWRRQRGMIEEFFRQSDTQDKKTFLRTVTRRSGFHIVGRSS